MGRTPRAEFVGALYHVFARGNRRAHIFIDEDDYNSYLDDLRDLSSKLDVAVIAYCLMPNHPHLCLQTDGAPISAFMHRLNTRHAKRFNRKYDVRGHLHEGRFKALAIDQDAYLLRLIRYIHQNPVRAGLVQDIADWGYSSHGQYLSVSPWVARERAMHLFGDLNGYRQFVAGDTSEDDRQVFSSAARDFRFAGTRDSAVNVDRAIRAHSQKPALLWRPLGKHRVATVDEVEAVARTWLETRAGEVSLETIQSPSQHRPTRTVRRDLVVYLRRQSFSLRCIGVVLNRDAASISRVLERAETSDLYNGKSGTALLSGQPTDFSCAPGT